MSEYEDSEWYGYDFDDIAEAGEVSGLELVEIHDNPRRRGRRKKKKKKRRRRRNNPGPAPRRRRKKTSNFKVMDVGAAIGGALVAGFVGGEVIPKIDGLPKFIKDNVGAVMVVIGGWLAIQGKTKLMKMLGIGMATGGAYALYMAWRARMLVNQLSVALESGAAGGAGGAAPAGDQSGPAVAGFGWYPGGPALNAAQAASLLGNNRGMNNPYGLQTFAGLAGHDTYHSAQFPGYEAGGIGMGSLDVVQAGWTDPSVDQALQPDYAMAGLGALVDADQNWQQDGYAYVQR